MNVVEAILHIDIIRECIFVTIVTLNTKSKKKRFNKMKKEEIYNRLKEVFSEIDKAIESCICANPKTWNESQFRKKYLKIKEKWLGKGK